uniref:Uncharacterized protein n=1 Tax=Palpitomonas bilix TaxID=652834 RepID=A0A7S3DFN4_9EUKA
MVGSSHDLLESLVKYDPPNEGQDLAASGPLSTKGRSKLPPVEKAPQLTQIDEILNAILPPREVDGEDGKSQLQYVSAQPSTRLDVINLQEQLDQRLQYRQARETGICPIREELYAQTFDELIREVTIDCPERGLLLLRVRDEIRMTIAAYQTLYESSVAFGTRKSLQAEQGKAGLEPKIGGLETEKRDLERQVQELKLKCENIEKRYSEQRWVHTHVHTHVHAHVHTLRTSTVSTHIDMK